MKTNNLSKRLLTSLTILIYFAAFVFAGPLTPKQNKKGKWGYVDNAGEWVIKAKYDSVATFDGTVATVVKDGQYGLINTEGKEVLKCKYSTILKIDSESYLAREAQDKWIGYDVKANDDFKLSNVEIENVNDHNIIITLTLDLGWMYSNNRYVKSGIFMNKNTGENYATDFVEYKKLTNNVYVFTFRNKNNSQKEIKAYTADGKLLIDKVNNFTLRNGGYVELTSASSQLPVIVSPNGETFITVYKTDYFTIVKNTTGKQGVLTSSMNIKLPLEYESVKPVNEGGFFVKKNGLWGYVPEDNGTTIPCKYSNMSYVSGDNGENVFIVTVNDKKGIISKTGEELLPCKYDDITKEGFYHGFLLIHKDNTVGIYDRRNKTILVETGKYSSIKQKTPGPITVVTQNGREGALDKNGNLIIPCNYKEITRNNLGGPDTYTVWDDDGSFGICNESGKLIIPCGKYEKVKAFEPYAIIVQNGKKIGAVKYDGTQFAPVVYDNYMNGFRNMAFGKNTMTGGTMYVYTLNGKFVASKTFRNSDNWSIRRFVQDYLM